MMKTVQNLSLLNTLWLALAIGLMQPLNAKAADLPAQVPIVEFGSAQITLKDVRLTVEYAHNFEQRARGLMHRADLCAQCGMLFEFEYPRTAGFWMKNTLIPLDIAYIDSDGIIADIKPMYPLVLESVPSSRPVKYALEMNQGWFVKQGIIVGDKMDVVNRSMVSE